MAIKKLAADDKKSNSVEAGVDSFSSASSSIKMFTVLAGSYEHVLFGYDCLAFQKTPKKSTEFTVDLKPVFMFESHNGCVTAMDVAGTMLATGGTDEHINLYNLKRRVEHGSILKHQGTITALEYYQDSHLLSCALDGLMCIWRVKDWECMKELKGHRGGINDISVHPSGKIALTVGRDRTMRTWDLIKGRCSFVSKLKREGLKVEWSPCGNYYSILNGKDLVVHKLEDASVALKLDPPFKVTTVKFTSGNNLVMAGDSEEILMVELESGKYIHKISNAHKTRVKDIVVLENPLADDSEMLVSVSSDGFIKVWNICLEIVGEAQGGDDSVASVDTDNRLTCLSIFDA
eukprot:Nk52_evm41s2630 gene=Nk52_evmTU41s2630